MLSRRLLLDLKHFCRMSAVARLQSSTTNDELDSLYSSVDVEVLSHDPAVLRSYIAMVGAVCAHLKQPVETQPTLPWHRRHEQRPHTWLRTLNRSAFAQKKAKIQYETRTHIVRFRLMRLTGSTADTILEYLQRQLPEGVAMAVIKNEIRVVPELITNFTPSMQNAEKTTSEEQEKPNENSDDAGLSGSDSE